MSFVVILNDGYRIECCHSRGPKMDSLDDASTSQAQCVSMQTLEEYWNL